MLQAGCQSGVRRSARRCLRLIEQRLKRGPRELSQRGQIGWPRRFPIVQFPNPPLLLAVVGWGLAALAGGTAHDIGRVVFTLGLVVWALEEAIQGVNWFRRLLGVGVLVWIAASLASEL